ncbi:MAG TPA: hypothetical protein GXZ26_03690 [Firmicutes bacterium]|jgi:hypothetical protein|nr:hypothetical protein [Bacillota bacterium]
MGENKTVQVRTIFLVGLPVILIFILLLGGKMKKNNTADFFEGIEIQYETKEQKAVIIEAIEDMLTLDAEDLRKKEYLDYFRKGEKIGIEQVIYSYFVPDDVKKTLGGDFYQELNTKEVKELLTKLLQKLRPESEEDIELSSS